MKENLSFGCIADDFTGASDVASFLVNGGMDTVLYNGIPNENLEIGDSKAVVIALKTRTQEKKSAIEDTLEAVKWMKNQGVKQLYIKYCSTFDSTKDGNIGPILDQILEEYNLKYTILCPSIPVNGRIVKDGHLYVNGVLLHESHMRNHPLTPMWDSDIQILMESQSKYKCLKLSSEQMKMSKSEILSIVEEFGKVNDHFYVIPDYVDENDAKKIVDVFGDLQLLSGGSGLMTSLASKYSEESKEVNKLSIETEGKGILLAGSCSRATLEQIEYFKNSGGKSVQIDPLKLLNKEQTIDDIWEFIKLNKDEEILIYSSDKSDKVKKIQEIGKDKIASLLESTMAKIAKLSVEEGYTRIIVAGGETSGAVTKNLEFESYIIGESIAPGVPVMIPCKNKDLRLVLKSGNFGQEDFFIRALNMTRKGN